MGMVCVADSVRLISILNLFRVSMLIICGWKFMIELLWPILKSD
jgi:hypothetical protein